MRISRTAAAVTAVTAIAVVGISGPAEAASVQCYATGAVYHTCKTGSLYSNAAHDIRVYVAACKGAPYWVVDTDTTRSVAHGTGTGQSVPINIVVHGLYGRYYAKLTDSCSNDYVKLQDI